MKFIIIFIIIGEYYLICGYVYVLKFNYIFNWEKYVWNVFSFLFKKGIFYIGYFICMVFKLRGVILNVGICYFFFLVLILIKVICFCNGIVICF